MRRFLFKGIAVLVLALPSCRPAVTPATAIATELRVAKTSVPAEVSPTVTNAPTPAPASPVSTPASQPQLGGAPNCRFGITAPLPVGDLDLSSLGVSAVLNWSSGDGPPLPEGVRYIQVLRLRDDLFDQLTPQALTDLVNAHPGADWIVGNEPDTTYEGQDGLLPEVYAVRFYLIARQIRALDPTARIGFGSIVQPTPIRLRYLSQVWGHLVNLAGGQNAASALIDFWSIHAFILNEWPDEWGTGVPPGFKDDYLDAVHYLNSPFPETHSFPIFQQRVEDFRTWMLSIGQRDKPLWITEYGSLLPPIDQPGGPDQVNLPDGETANYMRVTFNYMLFAASPQTGYPPDDDHLVQRWFWYSLNDHRYTFGGTLFDPDQAGQITPVGQAFVDFVQRQPAGVDVFVWKAEADEQSRQTTFFLGNSGSRPFDGWLRVNIYSGEGKTLFRGMFSAALAGCGGSARVEVHLPDGISLTDSQVEVLAAGDLDVSNNRVKIGDVISSLETQK